MRRAAWVVGEHHGEHHVEPMILVDEVPCPACGAVILGTFVAHREVWSPEGVTFYVSCPACFEDVPVVPDA